MDNLRPMQQPLVPGSFDVAPENRFDFWGVLNRRKWIVFLGLVCGTAVGLLYHYQTPPTFQSIATIRIEPKDPLVNQLQRYQRAPLSPNPEDILPTRHDKIIRSEYMIKKCLEDKNNALFQLKCFDGMTREEIVKYVEDNLEVMQDREDMYLYSLTFTCRQQEDSYVLLNALIETYNNSLKDQYREKTQSVTQLLTQMKDTFEKDYQTILTDLSENAKRYTSPRINDRGENVLSASLPQMQARIRTSQDRLESLMQGKNRAEAALQSGDRQVMETQIAVFQQQNLVPSQTYNQQVMVDARMEQLISQMEINLMKLKATFGSGHKDVKALQAELEAWKGYAEEKKKSNASISQMDPIVVLTRVVEYCDQMISDETTRLYEDNTVLAKAMEEAKEMELVATQQKLLEERKSFVQNLLLDTKHKILELDPSGSLAGFAQTLGFNFAVLRNASLGEIVWPILPLVLVLGGIVGSLLGFGLGILVDLADKTFHNPEEIIKNLSLPLIGHIPVINQSKRYQIENSLIDGSVCTYHRPKSQNSESFRAIRTALYFNSQNKGQDNTVIQVTSPTPGDGKSTVAANLAVSIAQSGKRVLLVDADMRRPRLGSVFGISSKEGFATVMSGESLWKDVIFECEEIEGLSIMPCGAKPSNPAELSTSPQLKMLIAQLREHFDYVIIDTPPILAVTDPCPIAARVDGVVLAIRIKKNVRTSAERSVEILRNLGANIFGVVVNGVGAQTGYGSQYTYSAYRSGYAYNEYGYGYGYGYGNHYTDDTKGTVRQKTPRLVASSAPASPKSPVDDDGPINLDIED